MANPDASLRAFKAMPGAATPTVAPQGANAPSIGHVSPLTAQLANERGYANSYGPFLPRPTRDFTQGAFGPFSPILPVPVDEPAPGAELPDARLWQYVVGWNLPVGQPGTEGIKLADFGTLKTLADLYSVARACIELRKNEIIGLEWDIIPTKDAAKAYYGSDKLNRDFGNRRGQALKFFRKPDPDYNSFRSFLTAFLEEVFVFDALSLLIRPKRGKGMRAGVLGSDLDCIELISGPTMRPLVGMHGETPRPPAPAYQQYLYGVPRSDYMTMITERDLEEGGLAGAEVNSWTTDQFLYAPLVPRRWTPYGFPPIERALIPVMSGIQKQAYQLDYFKEGTIPAVYISPGDVNMTPNQIRELQDALNAFAGDPAWHHKVIVLPPGSKVDPQKPVDVADQFDDIVMTQVCQAFDVNPMELGILPKVAATASPSQIKQMAQGAASVHERLSTKPLLKYLADIFDSILQDVLHQYDMKFTFEGLTEDAEQGMLTNLLVQQVQSGLRSVDEARDALELQPWNLPMTSGPVVFTAAGAMPFGMTPLPATQGQAQGGAQNAVRQAPTAGPAPLQQAGRQGGEPAPTPGHVAAAAANASSRAGRAPAISAPASGSVSAVKSYAPVAALESELDMLVRHLNKGRRITTWVPRYIPAQAMAIMSEDLAKGLSPEQCADIAKTILLGKGEYEWLPKAEARRDAPWTDLSATYSPLILKAFNEAVIQVILLIRQWWSGQVVYTRNGLIDQIRQIISIELEPVLNDLWADAWRMFDGTAGGYFDAWAASHGRDNLERISSSRLRKVQAAISEAVTSGRGADYVIDQLQSLLDVGNRAEMIAVTEMGRAATAAQLRNFVSTQVTMKTWETANDGRVCQVCRLAQDEGPVPLDSLFANGLAGPPAHPRCRCSLVPFKAAEKGEGPPTLTQDEVNYRPATDAAETCGDCVMWRAGAAGKGTCTLVMGEIRPDDTCDRWYRVEQDEVYKGSETGIHGVEQDTTCERGHTHHGEFGAAGVLIRHKGQDGKLRFLLQKRSPWEDDPGTWSLPGGALLQGETPLQGAFREAQEELGPFPPTVAEHHHVVDDHGGWSFTTIVCDVPEIFHPDISSGDTPEESSGFGWFTKDEIGDLPLHPGFADAWEAVIRTRKNTEIGKCAVRRVGLNGQVTWTRPEVCPCEMAQGGGGYVKRPHTVDDIQYVPDGEGPCDGRASGSRGGGTAENWDDGSQRIGGQPAPEWEDDSVYPQHRGVPPKKGPIPQGYQGGHWPQGGHGTQQAPAGPIGGGRRGIGKSALLRDVMADRTPMVMQQLEENFPAQALEWVTQAKWSGPLLVPLNRIDFSEEEQWAAWHETDRVDHFRNLIRRRENFNPVVLVKVPGHMHYRVVDGHHRALAYKREGMPLKAWIGIIPFGLVHVAEETHSSQLNQGDSKENE